MTDRQLAEHIVAELTGPPADQWPTHEVGDICRARADRLAANAVFMATARTDIDAAIADLLEICIETGRAIGDAFRARYGA